MQLYKLFYKRKPYAVAAAHFLPALCPGKRFKNGGMQFFHDADTVVDHTYFDHFIGIVKLQVDIASFGGVFICIGYEIGHNQLYLVGVNFGNNGRSPPMYEVECQ